MTPKLMTMAVSTSACGSGSAKSAGSPDPMIGGSPRAVAVTNTTLAPWPIRPRPMMSRRQLALQHQVRADAEQRGRGERQQHAHVAPPSRLARRRRRRTTRTPSAPGRPRRGTRRCRRPAPRSPSPSPSSGRSSVHEPVSSTVAAEQQRDDRRRRRRSAGRCRAPSTAAPREPADLVDAARRRSAARRRRRPRCRRRSRRRAGCARRTAATATRP